MNDRRSAKRPPVSFKVLGWLREGLKLFGIALLGLAAVAVTVLVSVKTGITVPKRWFGLCFWTGFLVWLLCRQYRSHLWQTRFWFVFVNLLLVHVAAFTAILRRYPDWGLGWFMLPVMFEAPFMALILGISVDKTKRRSSHGESSHLPG